MLKGPQFQYVHVGEWMNDTAAQILMCTSLKVSKYYKTSQLSLPMSRNSKSTSSSTNRVEDEVMGSKPARCVCS
jgi:hypothetical protein